MSENLIAQLAEIVGDSGLRTDGSETQSFLTDWHGQYHGKAIAVVLPETTAQVSAIMALCDAKDIVVVPQGGNTGFMGGATPDAGPSDRISQSAPARPVNRRQGLPYRSREISDGLTPFQI